MKKSEDGNNRIVKRNSINSGIQEIKGGEKELRNSKTMKNISMSQKNKDKEK